MPTLVLIRHGQSAWNLENRFTGWWDVDLTALGIEEARLAGSLLRENLRRRKAQSRALDSRESADRHGDDGLPKAPERG